MLEFLELPLDELEMNVEGIERVAQLVGHARRQKQDGGGSLVLDAPLGPPLVVGYIRENRRKAAAGDAALAAEGNHVEPDGARLGIGELEFPGDHGQCGLGVIAVQRGPKRRPEAGDEAPEHLPRQRIVAEPDQAVRGGIGIVDRPLGIDDEDPLLEDIENLLEQPARPGQPLNQVRQVHGVQGIEPSQDAVQRGVFLYRHRAQGYPEPWAGSTKGSDSGY